MSQELLTDVRDNLMWVTINRPERRNAVSPDVLQGISRAIDQANADRSVRAIILTGTGDAAFCAGADLQTGKSFVFDYSEPRSGFANLFRKARQSTVPLIARVNGACMAGGMGIMSMCDLAVSAAHARFGLPEVKVGVFPAQVLTVLQHLIGRRKLTELCITGEPIDAREALQIGLVNAVHEDVDQALDALVARLLDKSPAAIRRGLYLMKTIDEMAFEESMAFTESQIALFALTEDAKEGQLAFREKRKPVWTGR
ncbi:enoyl-CoA hydratase/isomerase family protein [Achromobacter sp. GG226]|uniref:enoyl-CoA hydratase/isomerase family protein n=1 Tax=Verticiella alkaliphila TaxID=2779529 RepID=UPI001C0E79BE|nr:enoyl-CoA hydratase/isomerase family protein [Verticiella sp. GG226]MBU4611138.1 enoyl-CoA hydratase/isomerase family protein [Verticiella sp. GG226]